MDTKASVSLQQQNQILFVKREPEQKQTFINVTVIRSSSGAGHLSLVVVGVLAEGEESDFSCRLLVSRPRLETSLSEW